MSTRMDQNRCIILNNDTYKDIFLKNIYEMRKVIKNIWKRKIYENIKN